MKPSEIRAALEGILKATSRTTFSPEDKALLRSLLHTIEFSILACPLSPENVDICGCHRCFLQHSYSFFHKWKAPHQHVAAAHPHTTNAADFSFMICRVRWSKICLVPAVLIKIMMLTQPTAHITLQWCEICDSFLSVVVLEQHHLAYPVL